jgi:hypothetical protein
VLHHRLKSALGEVYCCGRYSYFRDLAALFSVCSMRFHYRIARDVRVSALRRLGTSSTDDAARRAVGTDEGERWE